MTIESYNCFNFIDHRNNVKGYVEDQSNGDLYGRHMGFDSDADVRIKFSVIALAGNALIGPLRIVYRLGCLLIGTWAKNGYDTALKAWKQERFACVQANEAQKAPGKAGLYLRVMGYVLFAFLRDLGKLLTYPLALGLMELFALYGLIRPLDGRKLFAATEHAYRLDLGAFKNKLHLQIANYMAPCMQPKRVADAENFYAVFPDYHPDTLRSLLRTIRQLRETQPHYFQDLDLTQLDEFSRQVKLVSSKDGEETDNEGALKEDGGLIGMARGHLKTILQHLGIWMAKKDEEVDLTIESADTTSIYRELTQLKADLEGALLNLMGTIDIAELVVEQKNQTHEQDDDT